MMQSPAQKIEAACLILAGGQGKRLTPDKPLLEINGQPIIERVASVVGSLFEEVLIVTNTPDKYAFLFFPLVADERQGCGPLMGIYSGLLRINNDVAFVCAADMPFLDQEVIRSQFRELGAYDIAVPWPQKRPQFLHAFYRKSCLPAMRETLDAGGLKIEMLTKRCKTRNLDSHWFTRHGLTPRIELAFTNINTLDDYRRWRTHVQAEYAPQKPGVLQRPGEGASPDALTSLAPMPITCPRR